MSAYMVCTVSDCQELAFKLICGICQRGSGTSGSGDVLGGGGGIIDCQESIHGDTL